VLALLLLALLGTAGCASSTAPRSVTLTMADNGQTVTVQSGGEVLLTLVENPTSGYTWAIAQINETVLGLTSSTYTAPTFSSGVTPPTGEGGTHTFLFTAKRAGTSPLALRACHAWECTSSIVERFAVTIQVV
jgi:inhibitor of cysteine peptidase